MLNNKSNNWKAYSVPKETETDKLNNELKLARNVIERQALLIEKAKEKIIEQEGRILELQEENGEDEGGNERLMVELEKKVEIFANELVQQQRRNRVQTSHIKAQEKLLAERESKHHFVLAIKSSEITTLRELLEEEKEGRVKAEMELIELQRFMENLKTFKGFPSMTVPLTGTIHGIPLSSSQQDDQIQARLASSTEVRNLATDCNAEKTERKTKKVRRALKFEDFCYSRKT